MAQHRMGARGNATSFPLPWESVLLELQRTEDTGPAPDSPWVGEELAERVSLLLKTRDESDPKAFAHHVHQAMVRRRVVVQLIEGAVARGHRAYASVAIEHVREKALKLPDQGVPPEIIHLLPHDTDLDKVQVQKAATPVPGRTDIETAARKLGQNCPNAVVLEKSGEDDGDMNVQRIAALRLLTAKLAQQTEAEQTHDGAKPIVRVRHTIGKQPRRASRARPIGTVNGRPVLPSCPAAERLVPKATSETSPPRLYGTVNGKRVYASSDKTAPNEDEGEREKTNAESSDKFVMTTGSAMLDQFQPWYFGVAYAFLFKYCTGMPDMPEWSTRPRYRRPDDAPRVPTSLWVRVMSRRVEAQLARDWNFGYASWNFLFRSTINLSRTLYSYEGRSGDAGSSMTAEQLEEGAVSLCKALSSHYKDTNGKLEPVNGDMTKLRYVLGLSRAAQRLLQNLEHTS